jgi:hypothetical protein
MKCDKLSHRLLELGFFPALGTSEYLGLTPKETHVKRGTPNTHNYNNGTTMICDELGRPWLIPANVVHDNAQLRSSVEGLKHEFALQLGGYVPHSNDGGKFLRSVIEPAVMENLAALQIA